MFVPNATFIALDTHLFVNATTLYRRWTDARELVAAVAVGRLMRDNPVPDTGSVRAR
jgi:hypothetical protein